MGKGLGGVLLSALGAKTHVIKVTGSTRVNDRFILVHFQSDSLLKSEGEIPGDWIRGWFPDSEQNGKLFQRAYTLINTDPIQGSFDIGFVQHHPLGPAARWASTCQRGDEIEATRYSGKQFALLNPAPAGYLFLGDLASYAAISELAAAIPQTIPVVVKLISREAADSSLPLPEGSHISANWVSEMDGGQGLVDAISGHDYSGWYGWIAAESTETRLAKSHLQNEHGLSKVTLHSQAYWIRGKAMGKS